MGWAGVNQSHPALPRLDFPSVPFLPLSRLDFLPRFAPTPPTPAARCCPACPGRGIPSRCTYLLYLAPRSSSLFLVLLHNIGLCLLGLSRSLSRLSVCPASPARTLALPTAEVASSFAHQRARPGRRSRTLLDLGILHLPHPSSSTLVRTLAVLLLLLTPLHPTSYDPPSDLASLCTGLYPTPHRTRLAVVFPETHTHLPLVPLFCFPLIWAVLGLASALICYLRVSAFVVVASCK
ncbi:hypothetical protein B0H19DRAFT_1137461 [Mycena capillaripes]|nr:hypothetical protein B0H19DRAFT_1137461 [Mycena capillaripes]